MKAVAAYLTAYLFILQFALPNVVPDSVVYNYRVNYDLIKDRSTNIEAVFKHIKKVIDREKPEDYIIILGDSVAYSNPGPSDKSIARYLNDKAAEAGRRLQFFNLAVPAAQIGDIYALLLKMKQYGISNEHVIMDIAYAGFVMRNPDPPPVFWFQKQLQDMDPYSYNQVEKLLLANKKGNTGYNSLPGLVKDRIAEVGGDLTHKLFESVSVLSYKDYIQSYLTGVYDSFRGRTQPPQEVKPWYEKQPWLGDLLKEYEYQTGFSAAPFVMNETNPQVFFLNKILDIQRGKDTLIFLTALNYSLMKNNIDKPGFKENMIRIDNFFRGKQTGYINFNGSIDYNLFSDHVHFTPAGYDYLSGRLWDVIKNWNI